MRYMGRMGNLFATKMVAVSRTSPVYSWTNVSVRVMCLFNMSGKVHVHRLSCSRLYNWWVVGLVACEGMTRRIVFIAYHPTGKEQTHQESPSGHILDLNLHQRHRNSGTSKGYNSAKRIMLHTRSMNINSCKPNTPWLHKFVKNNDLGFKLKFYLTILNLLHIRRNSTSLTKISIHSVAKRQWHMFLSPKSQPDNHVSINVYFSTTTSQYLHSWEFSCQSHLLELKTGDLLRC